jgi:hypothetical protein
MMPVCTSCGSQNDSEALFCANCGGKIEAQSRVPIIPSRGNSILLDKTHYESLGSFAFSEDALIKICKEVGYQVRVLKGSWKKHYFEDSTLFHGVIGVILGGIEKWDKVSKQEQTNLKAYVKSGGTLLITCASHILMEDSTVGLNKFVRAFGIRFAKKKAQDEQHHEGRHSDHVLIHNFIQHPLTSDVNMISFYDHGGMTIQPKKPEVQALAFTDEDAIPPNQPVLVVIPYGEGKVIAFSCSSFFSSLGLEKNDNRKLARNILKFFNEPLRPLLKLPQAPAIEDKPAVQVITAGEAMGKIEIASHLERLKGEGIPEYGGENVKDRTIRWNPKIYLERVWSSIQCTYTSFFEIGEERLKTYEQTGMLGILSKKQTYVKIKDRLPILLDDEELTPLGDYLLEFTQTKSKFLGKFYYTGRRFILDTEDSEVVLTYEIGETPPKPGRPMFSFWIKPEFQELYQLIGLEGWEEGMLSKKKYTRMWLEVGTTKKAMMEMDWIMEGPKDTKSESKFKLAKTIAGENEIQMEDASRQIREYITKATSTNVLDIIKYSHACLIISGAMSQGDTGSSHPTSEIRSYL